jgi:DNA-binding LytR/AlgR family response regulator
MARGCSLDGFRKAQRGQGPAVTKRVKRFYDSIYQKQFDMLAIPHSAGSYLLEPGNILRVEASSNYYKIHFDKKQKAMVLPITLMRVQEGLPADMFLRVHRSHLVNKLYVKQVSGGEAKIIELTNGDLIAVSRRKHSIIKSIHQQNAGAIGSKN